jgi:hypothetical protein
MPVFPKASQNIVTTAMIMHSAPKPSSDEGKCIYKELYGLLEAATI